MAVQIQVKLDPAANPPVSVVPKQMAINRGNNTIEWTPFAGQDFTFVSLKGLPSPPFSAPVVTASKISVQNDHTTPHSAGAYSYTIVVSYKGQNYGSSATPPGATGFAQTSPTGSSPTIRNN